jgi:hypothetical protein
MAQSSGNGDGRNGTDSVVPFRLSLIDSRPQQKPVQLDDGSVMHGYSKGKRTLRSVEAAFLDAWKTGHNDDGTQRSQSEFDESLTQMVMAVVPQMTHEDADSLNRDEIWQLLVYLGWFTSTDDGAGGEVDPQTMALTTDT